MHNFRFRIAVITILMITSLAMTQAASAASYYLQAELGRTTVDDDIDIDGMDTLLDDSTNGFRLAFGLKFTRYFGIEAGYVDLGSLDVGPDILPVKASADGTDLSLVGRLPISDRVSLIAKAGNLWWDGELGVAGLSASESDSDAYFSIGLQVSTGKRTGIGVNISRYELDDLELGFASLGLRLNF